MSELGVPVVDISGFFTGNDAARSRVAREVAAAVEGIGFLTIVGHGVPENLMKDVSAAYRSFFDLPLEIKRKYVNRARNTNRGYVPFGDEFVASSHGAEAPPDWRETFAFGRFDVPDNPYYTHANAGYAYEDNILPSEAAGMVATAKSFYRALEDLNLRMLKNLRRGARYPRSLFLRQIRQTRLRAARHQLSRPGPSARARPAPLRRPFGFRNAHVPADRRCPRRAAGAQSGRRVGRYRPRAGLVRHQYRRPDDDLDQ